MRALALAVVLLGVGFAVVGLWPHEAAASSPGGVSLAHDWTLDLVEAQPTSNYWNRAQSDARYCKLTGCTMSGPTVYTADGFQIRMTNASLTSRGISFNAADTATLAYNANTTIMTVGSAVGVFLLGAAGARFQGPLYYATGSAEALNFTSGGYAKWAGVATGSLPTCNAGAESALTYDSTVSRLAICDDSTGSYAWRYLAAGASAYTLETHAINLFGGNSGSSGAASEDLNFLGPGYQRDSSATWTKVTVDMVACNWATEGTGGTTGVVVQVYDATDSAEICSCTLGACTTSARQPLSCACGGALVEEDAVLTLRLKSTTDCATNPTEVTCNVMATIAP